VEENAPLIGTKESDADNFFSLYQLGVLLVRFKGLYKETVKESTLEKPEAAGEKKDLFDAERDDLVMLEEERLKLEEEKRKIEEAKKKKELERKIALIEAKKEIERRRKLEANEREKIQERLKDERRRGINHPYKDFLASLSRRIRKRVPVPDEGTEKEIADKKKSMLESLKATQQMFSYMLFLITVVLLILVATFAIHPELSFFSTNAIALIFLLAYGINLILQIIALLLHRFETMFNSLAYIAMKSDCTFVDDGKKNDRRRQQYEKQDVTVLNTKEGYGARVARRLLMVDKRAETKANLQY